MSQWLVRPLLLSASALAVLTACSSSEVPDEQVYYCGAQQIRVTPNDEYLTLNYAGQEHELRVIESASGARYVNDDEEYQVSFWSRGEQGRFEVNGQSFPECRQAGAIIEPFSARGNEPFWRVDIENDQAIVTRMGEEEESYQVVERELREQRTHLASEDEEFQLTVSEELCQDDMSGMFYPQSVMLELAGETLRGCAGQSARLLQGVEWQVVALGDSDYQDHDVTVLFMHDNHRGLQLAGRAACNRYFGSYELSGESLTVGQLAGTKMACEDETMRVEYEFLNALSETQHFSVERESPAADVVYLHTSEGRLRLEQE